MQRYREPLSDHQRSQLLKSRPLKGPKQKICDLKQALLRSNYGANSLLESCGVSISKQFTRIVGHVLTPPKLIMGNKKSLVPRSGKWNIAQTKVVAARKLERWAAVNFSAPCDTRKLCQDLIRCGEMIGYSISDPLQIFEEKPENASMLAMTRVVEMIEKVLAELVEVPKILLCILPQKKNCHLYGPWKRKTLCEVGVATQCVAAPCVSEGAPVGYMKNLLLKAVGSMAWPSLTRYLARARTQSPKSNIFEALFDKVSDTKDHGLFRELLCAFHQTTTSRLPKRIIIFRDRVSESQFDHVLNVELKQMIESCKFMSVSWSPKFMVVVAQKRHDTRFFRSNFPSNNVPPGTLVDTGVCHPRNNDFYLCAHASTTGTPRPTHYHVLCDKIGCSAAEIQEFVHALSFVYQPSSNATSIVAPIIYAHRAGAKWPRLLKPPINLRSQRCMEMRIPLCSFVNIFLV